MSLWLNYTALFIQRKVNSKVANHIMFKFNGKAKIHCIVGIKNDIRSGAVSVFCDEFRAFYEWKNNINNILLYY